MLSTPLAHLEPSAGVTVALSLNPSPSPRDLSTRLTQWEFSSLSQDWQFNDWGVFNLGYLCPFQVSHCFPAFPVVSALMLLPLITLPWETVLGASYLRTSLERSKPTKQRTSLVFTALNSQHLTSPFISHKKKINKFSLNLAVKNRRAFKKLLWVGKHMATDLSSTRIWTNSHMVAWAIMTKTRLYILWKE